MTERPILFSGDMVRALRGNRKTQTRRTMGPDKINECPDAWRLEGEMNSLPGIFRFVGGTGILTHNRGVRCPYGVAGDRLWTRESWRVLADYNFRKPRELTGDWIEYFYEADGPLTADVMCGEPGKLRPGMFLPRWASRDTLEVISARPERLQKITEVDAKAEGCGADEDPSARNSFEYLWHEINGAKSWMENPWVWRVEFRRIS